MNRVTCPQCGTIHDREIDSEEALTERLWQHIWIPVEPQEPDIDDSVDHTSGVLGDLDEQTREL
jgi:hypothetical protein